MIRLFESGRRLLYFPRKWANSVSRWLLGVHSPEGTINITGNTANPEGEKSVGFDVNIGVVASRVRARISALGFTAMQRSAVKDIIRDSLDGFSLVWKDGNASVNSEWLQTFVENLIPESNDPGAQQPDSTSDLESGFDGIIASHAKKGGTFQAGAAGGAGKVVKLCCRGMDDGQNGTIFWRPFTITSDGRIFAIGAETDAMGMYTDQ